MMNETSVRQGLLDLQTELQQRLDRTQNEEREEVSESQDTAAQLWEASEIRDGLNDEAANELDAVNRALIRLDAGTYGVCAGCGKAIDPRRLEAVPYAEFCMPCSGSSM